MPAPIPLEPPVTSATLPLNDFACVAAIDFLLVLTFCVLDSSVQNATQKVLGQGRSKRENRPSTLGQPLTPKRDNGDPQACRLQRNGNWKLVRAAGLHPS